VCVCVCLRARLAWETAPQRRASQLFLYNVANSVELQKLKCYFNNELTAFSISFSLISFKATLFSSPKSVLMFWEKNGFQSVRSLFDLSLSLLFLFTRTNERTNEQTNKQIQIITQNISSSYRISRTVSVPPRALLWSTPAWSDSPLLTFRTILGGNFSPLPSVWTFGISGTATRAPLWDLRTLSTLLLLIYSVFQLLFNYCCCCLLVASACYLSSNVFRVMGCHARNWMKTLKLHAFE